MWDLVSPNVVVSYWISTSNHNSVSHKRKGSVLYLIEFLHQTTTEWGCIAFSLMLYLIEFLHQTTTSSDPYCFAMSLYLIEFLHQTTTAWTEYTTAVCCILLNFYIKPQQSARSFMFPFCCILLNFYIKPQPASQSLATKDVVSYWISTSNHNHSALVWLLVLLYLIEFLHQTTT